MLRIFPRFPSGLIAGLLVTCLFASVISAQSEPADDDFALESYYAANALFNKKLYPLAIEEYRSFLARYPNHEKFLNAKVGLALSLYELRRFDEAEPIFRELAGEREAPHLAQVHNLWGQTLLVLGRPVEAEAAFRWGVNRGKERLFIEVPTAKPIGIEESPQIAYSTVEDLEPLERAYAGLIEALFQQRKWDEVISNADELEELVPDGRYGVRTQFLAALAHYERDEFAEAETGLQALTEAGRETPFGEHIFFLLAETQREQGKLDAAAQNHRIVAREFSGRFAANALFRLGFIHFLQEDYAAAIRELTQLRQIYVESPFFNDAGIYLGRSQLESGNYDAAQDTFGSLTTDREVAAEATLWLGKTLLRAGEFTAAAEVLEPAVAQFAGNPLQSSLLFDYGNALLGQDAHAEAARVFGRVVDEEDDPQLEADAMRLRAFALHRANAYQLSLEACDAFLNRYPQDPQATDTAFLKAENIFFLGRFGEAALAYRQFIPFEGAGPFTNQAYFRIGQCRIEQERYEDALTEFAPLLRQRPPEPFFIQLDYLVGLAHFNLEQWQQAIGFFARFHEQHPGARNADGALIKLARCYEETRRPGEAREALLALVNGYPESVHLPQALAELGRYFYEDEEYDVALANLRPVVANHPESPFRAQAEYYLGWVALAQDRPQAARDHFAKVASDYPEHPLAADALFQDALLRLESGQLSEAETLFRRFLDLYPDDSQREEALFYYATALSRMNRHEQAVANLRRFVDAYPTSALMDRALFEWGWSARELGRPLEAIEQYEAILERFGGSELANRARFEVAEVYYEQEEYGPAITNLDILLTRRIPAELRAKALYRLGWSLREDDQERLAAETFERFVAEFPDSEFTGVAAYLAGEVRLEERDYRQALQDFTLAVEATVPLTGEVAQQALLRQGETQALTDRWAEAEETFRTFRETFPASEFGRRATMWLGWTLENQREYEQALAEYRKVLVNRQRDAIAARSQFQIGEVLFAMGEYDEAIKELVKVDVNYAFPEWASKALLEIGQILERQGLSEEAAARFREVMRKFPDTPEATVAQDMLAQVNATATGS